MAHLDNMHSETVTVVLAFGSMLGISDGAFRILAALIAGAEFVKTGDLVSSTGYDEIARMIDKCTNSVRIGVRELSNAGYVSRQLRPGRSNVTTILARSIRADIRKAIDRAPGLQHLSYMI